MSDFIPYIDFFFDIEKRLKKIMKDDGEGYRLGYIRHDSSVVIIKERPSNLEVYRTHFVGLNELTYEDDKFLKRGSGEEAFNIHLILKEREELVLSKYFDIVKSIGYDMFNINFLTPFESWQTDEPDVRLECGREKSTVSFRAITWEHYRYDPIELTDNNMIASVFLNSFLPHDETVDCCSFYYSRPLLIEMIIKTYEQGFEL